MQRHAFSAAANPLPGAGEPEQVGLSSERLKRVKRVGEAFRFEVEEQDRWRSANEFDPNETGARVVCGHVHPNAATRRAYPQMLGGGTAMLRVLTALALIVVPASFGTDGANAQLAGQEFYPIPSAAMSQADFLTGKKGTPLTLAGQLRLPKAGPEKQPAVILLHGAIGPGGTGFFYEEWTRVLNEAGFATFGVDSFAGRGIVNLPDDIAKVPAITRMVDAYRALEILAKHPMIDPTRIAVMGFSHGAPAALYSGMKRFREAHAGGDVQFAAHISVYGICFTAYREDQDSNKPLLMLHGTADDWLPIEACRRYADRLRKAGRDVRLMEYPDAHHGYDQPARRQPVKLAEAVTPRRFNLAEGENGAIVNVDTKQPFTRTDPCFEKGVTVAYHEAAAKKSHEDVIAFLKERLK